MHFSEIFDFDAKTRWKRKYGKWLLRQGFATNKSTKEKKKHTKI